MTKVDLLIKQCGELLTLKNNGPKKSEDLDSLDIIRDAAVAIDNGVILEVGDTSRLEKKYSDPAQTIDAKACVVMPGFVDPHTHIAFNATREKEFDMRIRGKSSPHCLISRSTLVMI